MADDRDLARIETAHVLLDMAASISPVDQDGVLLTLAMQRLAEAAPLTVYHDGNGGFNVDADVLLKGSALVALAATEVLVERLGVSRGEALGLIRSTIKPITEVGPA